MVINLSDPVVVGMIVLSCLSMVGLCVVLIYDAIEAKKRDQWVDEYRKRFPSDWPPPG